MSLSTAEEAQIYAQTGTGILPSGTAGLATQPFAQTFDRRFGTSAAFTPTTQTMYMAGIILPAGKVVTAITFVSVGAESSGSHLWYALYKGDLTLMAQATDNTGAAAMGANTAFRMALTAPQTCTYSGLYYLAFCCQATGMPTLLNITAASTNLTGAITGMTPIVAASSSTGLTATAPNPAGALTTVVNTLYAFVD